MSLLQIDNAFHTLRVAPDGNTLSLTPYAGPIATLKFVGGNPLSLVCQGTKHIVYAYPANGYLRVPFMATQALQITYSFNDAKGNAWKSTVYEEGKSNLLVAGKETTFKCGLPISVALKESHDMGGFSFTVEIKDAGGHSLGGLTDQKLQNPPAPTLQIKNAKGKVVKSIPFVYG
jgi:hypothetical protein